MIPVMFKFHKNDCDEFVITRDVPCVPRVGEGVSFEGDYCNSYQVKFVHYTLNKSGGTTVTVRLDRI